MSISNTRKRNRGAILSRKAALAQTVIISSVVLAFSVAVILLNTYRLNNQVEGRIDSIAALAETSLATAVWQVDHDSARDFINAVIEDPSVVFAQVVTGRETMASRSEPAYASHTFDFFQDSSRFRTRVVEIRKHGDWIGTYRMAVSMEGIRQDIFYNIIGTLVLALVLITAITQTTLYFSRKRLFEPLKRLEESSTAIADGDLDAPIDTRLQGELGSLARSIDDMRDSMRHLISDLQKSKIRLEDHRNSLERTIRERTDELEQKNNSLNQALEDIQDAKQAAEVANVAKSSFLASMSHEIRTPMNAILGMADILQETELSEDQTRYVQVFKTAGENLLEILDDILDLSKIEAGHITLDSKPFSLSETVDKACEIIAPKAEGKGLDFSCKVAPGLTDGLLGDPERLKQVILNLLGNSVKFTESGHVHLIVEPTPEVGDSPLIQFSVSDSGPGIQPDKLDSIFDAFTQADNSTTRRFGGTGLGLAISKELTRMMGGHIWVESSHGLGSTFLFTARFGTSVEVRPIIPESKHTPDHGQPPTGNVLMVEDSKYNAFVIQTYLKNTPCKLTVMQNGEDGLAAFKDETYNCVLMDIQMPGMDGYETTRAMRQWEKDNNLTRTPIVAMTAYAMSENARECIEAGADTHLAKPVKKSALFEMLRRIVPIPEPKEEATVKDSPMVVAGKSVTAAYSALEREDFSSLKVLSNDLIASGHELFDDVLTQSGDALQLAARNKAEPNTIRLILDNLSDHIEESDNAK